MVFLLLSLECSISFRIKVSSHSKLGHFSDICSPIRPHSMQRGDDSLMRARLHHLCSLLSSACLNLLSRPSSYVIPYTNFLLPYIAYTLGATFSDLCELQSHISISRVISLTINHSPLRTKN